MTAAPESPESALAAVLDQHTASGYFASSDGHRECFCGHVIDGEPWSAHVAAAILAATPTAARTEAEVRWADLAPDEQTRIGRDVANAYQTGLADGKRNSATRIAQLEADLAAARSALGAVEALDDPACCCGQITARLVVCPVHKVTR